MGKKDSEYRQTLHVPVAIKSPDRNKARTASNKTCREARRLRCAQKDALTFTSRGRRARRPGPQAGVPDGE